MYLYMKFMCLCKSLKKIIRKKRDKYSLDKQKYMEEKIKNIDKRGERKGVSENKNVCLYN